LNHSDVRFNFPDEGVVVALSMNSKKVWVEGCGLGVLLSFLSIILLNISDVTLLGAYALIVLLVSASLLSSERDGVYFGIFAVIAESVTDLVYYFFGYGLQALGVPYAVGLFLFLGKIPVLPLMAVIGGYLGRQYFAEKAKPRLRAKSRAITARKTGEKKKD
jgi:hypothetical protein